MSYDSELAKSEQRIAALERELKEAQAAAAVMRGVLALGVRVSPLRSDMKLQDQIKELKSECHKALTTTAGTAFLARMAEAEWLIKDARCPRDMNDAEEFCQWYKRREAFLKGEGVKA